MDYFTPITVGWIRPGYVGEITQLTITSYDHFHGHPSMTQRVLGACLGRKGCFQWFPFFQSRLGLREKLPTDMQPIKISVQVQRRSSS